MVLGIILYEGVDLAYIIVKLGYNEMLLVYITGGMIEQLEKEESNNETLN